MYYLLTLLGLTIVFWVLYQHHFTKVCAICAAVVITWSASLIALYMNASWADTLVVAILMGASMGALAEKYSSMFGLVWKSSMVILGLPAIYLLVNKELSKALIFLLILMVITLLTRPKSRALEDKKDIFGECC
jgi:hypothetical protein